MGRENEARAEETEVLKIDPKFTIERYVKGIPEGVSHLGTVLLLQRCHGNLQTIFLQQTGTLVQREIKKDIELDMG